MAAFNGLKQPRRACGTRTGQERVQVSYCSIDQKMGKYKSKYKWNNTQLYYSKEKKDIQWNTWDAFLINAFSIKTGKKNVGISTSFFNHLHLIFYQTTLFNPLLSIKN